MARVDEEPGDGSWPGVQVLVATPGGGVDVPVVELQRDVPDGVGEVPDHEDAGFAGGGVDSLHV